MDNRPPYEFTASAEERAARHAQRAAARKAREKARRRRLLLRAIPVLIALLAAAAALIFLLTRDRVPREPVEPTTPSGQQEPAQSRPAAAPVEQVPEERPYAAAVTADTITLGQELPSAYAVVIDLNTDTVLARKAERRVISPASMTKILTLLVAVEHLDEFQLQDTVTIDLEITDYCFSNDCSVAGFELGEEVAVEHLLYGCILPSGADASLALARYVAGSHEAFVELMNEKVARLGLSETAHFTNCVGIYDEENVCTVYDMAMIMKAALDNDLARRVLTTKICEIAPNDFHSEGMILSNWFLRRIEDHIGEGVEVLGAKTGYVNESGNCAASYAESTDGGRYICVTADASGSWRCIKDHVQIYDLLTGQQE